MLEEDKKWLVYQGSIYSQHKRIPNEHYIMEEAEWEERAKHNETGTAVVLARGLTKEVASAMCNLTKEQ